MRVAPFIFAALLLACLAGPAQSQSVKDVRDAIQKQQTEAEQRQNTIESLESKEQKLKRELSAIKAEVVILQNNIAAQEEALINIEAREAAARVAYRELQAYREKLVKELQKLVASLWPIHQQRALGKLQGVDGWQAADRRFTWLAAVYQATSDRLQEAIQTGEMMAENLEQQARLAREAEAQLATINTNKDSLLRKQLMVRRSLKQTESSISSLEKELNSILGIIKDLNYKLKTQRTKRFSDNKKLLPWPCDGTVVSSFAMNAKPPRRGIGLGTAEHAVVKSIFWGKIVHADIVRGLGRVVIVYHGHDYYSVYAYLSGTNVEQGQEVEKDEPIGIAGFDPRTKHNGIYLELRKGAKPINPVRWLLAR